MIFFRPGLTRGKDSTASLKHIRFSLSSLPCLKTIMKDIPYALYYEFLFSDLLNHHQGRNSYTNPLTDQGSLPWQANTNLICSRSFSRNGFICSEYSTISQIIRSINKQLKPDITTFDEIPYKSEYYKTDSGEDFMIFKKLGLQKLFAYYNKDIFANGTFYVPSKFSLLSIYNKKICSRVK
ncbi:hypothetical protein H8356DRAFT_1352897 [Neocallimastix lanati (nom. inval.)]|nr:hypothetical protein H8356DRAFT_1352897 [Neocallimastix sp. JGI-2020a]